VESGLAQNARHLAVRLIFELHNAPTQRERAIPEHLTDDREIAAAEFWVQRHLPFSRQVFLRRA
jgi:hypothetical protein